ncbi:MAG: DNA polymerase III subunit delta' [Ruminococcus sp.]|nr:DNA polymerase III subunit delta' [Ruminococcus sp.]
MKIYGNDLITGTFQNMLRNGRMAHSFLIYGEKGLGKKTMADYLALMLVCERDSKPCGECRSCRNAASHAHPDIIYAEHSGKLGGFSVETIRSICSDAYIRPNDSDKKVYIFTDADNITVSAQNSLLKLIEEPPPYAYFIFTASDKYIFLETIRSRVISLGASEVRPDIALEALCGQGIPESEADSVLKLFGGNIGKCLEYIGSDELRSTVDLTKKITDCIINRDEYGTLKHLTEAASEKNIFRSVLLMLDKVMRDSLAMKYSPQSSVSCCADGARLLSESLTVLGCISLHRAVTGSYSLIDKNVNIKLIASALCGQISECRQL